MLHALVADVSRSAAAAAAAAALRSKQLRKLVSSSPLAEASGAAAPATGSLQRFLTCASTRLEAQRID
ncbi:Protein of unknown function [Gryllus bimaculatus]|nr:Protein of unknown function [Gryllus bimaculatus]